MDGGGGIGECFTLSGFIKILESCAAFTCVMLHRLGDQGNEVNLEFMLRFLAWHYKKKSLFQKLLMAL